MKRIKKEKRKIKSEKKGAKRGIKNYRLQGPVYDNWINKKRK